MRTTFRGLALAAGAAFLLSACAGMEQSVPEVTHDGLHLMPSKKFAVVYMKPGVDVSIYEKFGVTDCQVAFKKNWMRDQNQDRIDLTNRVTQKDVEEIQSKLGAECKDKFVEALEKDPAYTLVEQFAEGEAVLVLRPAIINLDINAPDVRTTGMSRTYTTSAGEMTLYLELVDATTDEVLGRIIDRQQDYDDTYMTWTNSVTNKANADRILNRWASFLRDGLDQVRGG